METGESLGPVSLDVSWYQVAGVCAVDTLGAETLGRRPDMAGRRRGSSPVSAR